MLKNYFTIAIRHLTRHKLFSIINVLCLALGISFSLIIGVYVLAQYRINTSLKNVQRQYIIKSNWKVKDMGLDLTTFGPLPKALKEEYPGLVRNYYRYNPVTNVVSAGDKYFKEDISIGDTSFVSMYDFGVLYGDRNHAFTDNSSAVITETMAMKLFGIKDAVGKTISILTTHDGEKQDYRVSAVLKDIPYNSVTNLIGDTYSVYLPTEGNRYYTGGDPSQYWNSAYEVGMIELQPGIFPKDLEKPVRRLLEKNTAENFYKNLSVELAPVSDYYLNDHNGAVKKMIIILSIAAGFILLMAVINFVNINIGTSSYRIKEIGLRKVFGGAKRQLVIQFITEALLLTVVAAIFSMIGYQVLRSAFSQVLNTHLESFFAFSTTNFIYFCCLILVTGLIAGIYPAFVLSSSRVVNAVKGKVDTITGGLILRKAMLTVQFTLAIIVFICALTVSRQVNYIFNKDIGYNKEQVMVITAFPKQWDSAGTNKMINIRNALLQVPTVKDASLSFEIPERKPPNSLELQSIDHNNQKAMIASCAIDENYVSTYGLKLLSGSCFSQGGGYIPNQVVLNQSAARVLGLTSESSVNARLKILSANGDGPVITVAGVVKDFNYSNLQEAVGPVAFFHVRDFTSYRYLSLKLNTSNTEQSLSLIRNKWKDLSPNAPFEYTFMEDKFKSLYRSELQLKKAADIATVLNLIIVFLGIFGIVTFTLLKRTREIAVRKVLGADIKNIIALFVKDYAWLMLLANIIAWPFAFIITKKWLQGYAYRIDVDLSPYLIVCGSLFMASFIMISLQCLRAGLANPVKALKTE
jgi:putative ABC transport system permease protein